MAWDRLVIKACKKIEANVDQADHDFRPRIKDLNSGLYLLLDTGAALSVFPRSHCKGNLTQDVDKGLVAINGSKIPTATYLIIDHSI